MTTPAQLSAQVTEVLTRWNQQQDQLADWLTGDPAGGPNGDGTYPLTDAEGNTENFLCLPGILDQVSGPAASASNARTAAEAAQVLAEAAKAAADVAAAAAAADRTQVSQLKTDVITQRDDVAAKWSDVNFWHGQVSASQIAIVAAETATLTYRDETLTARDDTLVARNEAQVARDEAEGFAASINPATLVTTTALQAELDALVGAAPGTLDTLNEIAAALGDDPNFATTMTTSLAGKSNIGHGHVIADVSGLQTALDGKQAAGSYSLTGHNHTWAEITGKPSTFAPSAHTHIIGDVSGLQTALDGKQPVGTYAQQAHSHVISEVSGLQSALDGKLSAAYLNTRIVTDANAADNEGVTFNYLSSSAVNDPTGIDHGLMTMAYSNAWAVQMAGDWRTNKWYVRGQNNHAWSGWSEIFHEGHLPTISEVSGLQSALDGKAAASHTHSIANVSGLQTALDGKLATTGTAPKANAVGSTTVTQSGGLQYWNTTANTNINPTSNYWYGIRMAHGDAESYYSATIATDFFADDIKFRRIVNGTKQTWRTLWHDGNFDPASKANTSHTHTIANVSGLQTELNLRPTLSTTYSTNAASAGWYTIAQTSTARGYGEFMVYDIASGKHHFVKFAASASYGQNNVTVLSGNRYTGIGNGIQNIRILYNSSDRVYGGAKLQVYLAAPTNPLYFREMFTAISGWERWTAQNPVLENTPAGWAEDPTSRVDDVCNPSYSYKGNLLGSATSLETPRTINGVPFDGTANITIADNTKAPLANPSFSGVATATSRLEAPVLYSGSGSGRLYYGGSTGRSWIAPRNAADDNWEWSKEFGFDHATDRWYFDTPVYSASHFSSHNGSSRDKFRVYQSSTYAIGMQSAFTFGGLNDWAMTFQFSNNDTRGFWWGDTGHGQGNGAMALTTNGKLTVADSIRVGYGEGDTTAPGSTGFQMDVNGMLSAGGFRLDDATSGHQFMPAVSGGTFRANVNATGAIKIKMPTTGGADMISFWVDIYDYLVDQTVSVFIAGYVYQGVGSNVWVNETAIVLGAKDGMDYTVRFGDDGTDACVWIGETNTVRQYPQVVVRDVQAGHSATDPDGWVTGWNISLATSFGTIERTISGTFPMASKAKGITSGAVADGNITRSGQGALVHHGSSSHSSGKITVSTSAPSGGSNGDIWLQV